MLRPARPQDAPQIAALWQAGCNRPWLDPPEEGEIAQAIDNGLAFLWQPHAEPLGFACLFRWVPLNYSLRAMAVTAPGQGRLLLDAVLAHVFATVGAHRLGLDVTSDNTRAIALYRAAGFAQEGTVRECWQREDGGFVDCHLFGLLRREWQALAQSGPAA
jgi:ribosomal protein S18 acetylase RimI-like enzyme